MNLRIRWPLAVAVCLALPPTAVAESLVPAAASVHQPLSAAQAPPVVLALPVVRKAVDFVAARAHPPLLAPVTPQQADTLGKATLPVLLPDAPAWLQAGVATAERDWYALSVNRDGVMLYVQGDRLATLDPDLPPANFDVPTWTRPLVTRNEATVDATFLAFGVSYLVAVECARPYEDVRCTEDAFVLAQVASLRRLAVPAVRGGGR